MKQKAETMRKSMKTKDNVHEKISKIDKPLSRLT